MGIRDLIGVMEKFMVTLHNLVTFFKITELYISKKERRARESLTEVSRPEAGEGVRPRGHTRNSSPGRRESQGQGPKPRTAAGENREDAWGPERALQKGGWLT